MLRFPFVMPAYHMINNHAVEQRFQESTKFLNEWLDELIKNVKVQYSDTLDSMMQFYPENKNETPSSTSIGDIDKLNLHPPVKDMVYAILTDPAICMFIHQVILQQPPDNDGRVRITSWQLLVVLIDSLMTKAPLASKSIQVQAPLEGLFFYPLSSPTGLTFFQNDKVNDLLGNIWKYWAQFLTTKESCYVLNSDTNNGWFGEDALQEMPDLLENFECDVNAEFYGFKSWDDFFVRKFRTGSRPIAFPDDDDIIANACESIPYLIHKNLKRRDYFWIKSCEYSLDDLLHSNPLANEFIEGTLYHGFLTPKCYHRWHSPVSGRIRKIENIPGKFISLKFVKIDGFITLTEGQCYAAHVSCRTAIYIDADNPKIGLMCFVSIGLMDVSSNEVTVKEGQHVQKGEQIGMFHYGGSAHLLIFRPHVNVTFPAINPSYGDVLNGDVILVRSEIAKIMPNSSN